PASPLPVLPRRAAAAAAAFLFAPGPPGGLGPVRFPAWRASFAPCAPLPPVALLRAPVAVFAALLARAPPDAAPPPAIDFAFGVGP
ncbi:acyl-CoA dehydrogenase, partial [Mycobacterium tuberculosis]